MLNLKTSPVGIDVPIQQLQQFLHGKLKAAWEITDDAQYECYGRCYRNRKEKGYIAEVYTGNGEYKEVYWDDTLSVISWFGISRDVKYGIKNEATVHLVFFLDLSKVKPAVQHRADEEVRHDVTKLLTGSMYGFSLLSVDLWLENVLKEYQGTLQNLNGSNPENIKYIDMHPTHCFRLNFSLLYSNTNNC